MEPGLVPVPQYAWSLLRFQVISGRQVVASIFAGKFEGTALISARLSFCRSQRLATIREQVL